MSIKTSQISVQTFFMILMGIFFVWILIFSYNQLKNVNSQISEQDKIAIEKELKTTLEYCEDPLNLGSTKIMKIKHEEINTICLFKSTSTGFLTPSIIDTFSSQITPIKNAGDNVILLKSKYTSNPTLTVNEIIVTGSFKVENSTISESKCFFDDKKRGEIIVEISC